MASELLQFQSLLSSFLGTDNDVRVQAEASYESIPPQTKTVYLLHTMTDHSIDVAMRTTAAVLLRRLFTGNFDELWPALTDEQKSEVKAQLLTSAQRESDLAMKKKVCESVAEFARRQLDDYGNNTWTDILQFMVVAANGNDNNVKENALHIFSQVPGLFGSLQHQHIDLIKQMLNHCLTDPTSAPVRCAAVKAMVSFIIHNEKDEGLINTLKELLPAAIKVIEETIIAGQDDALLKSLIDLAESSPKFLRSHGESIIETCLKVVTNVQALDTWRQLALEVIVTLAESCPPMVRKIAPKFLCILVPAILLMMAELEEEDDWSKQEKQDDEEGDSNTIVAESSLDRLCCALGGKTVLPLLTTSLPSLLHHPEWTQRHAGLMAISACGEGCHRQMESILENIVGVVLPFLADPHPRVRYAACNAVGQLCTDFAPTLQKKLHTRVVPALLAVISDPSAPRVQAHAAAAVVNFAEECPRSVLGLYLEDLVGKLEAVLGAQFNDLAAGRCGGMVLEQVITTLAAIADTAEDKFTRYYDKLVPQLMYVLESCREPGLKVLRGKTMECITLIGLAVGKKRFLPDCPKVMELLLATQSSVTQDDDPQLSYMISAWARMCKVMGKDFEQYLPLVMGPVLKAAEIRPEVAVIDNAKEKIFGEIKVKDPKTYERINERLREDQKYLEEDDDWQFITLGDQQSFGIRTSGLEDKATACHMLVCYARELKESFAPYTEQVTKIMVPLLKFYFHDGVRQAAAESLPYLLQCAHINGPQYLADMWAFMVPAILAAIDTEPESDIKADHMSSLGQCIELVGSGCFNESQYEELVKVLEKVLKQHYEKQEKRQRQRKEEDYDEDLEEDLQDEDEADIYILSKLSDITHALFGSHKAAILPVFDRLLPYFVQLLDPSRPWADRQWGLCIFDDVLEHTGPSSLAYRKYFLDHMINYICDKQPEVRQAATFGCGVMAMHGGTDYVPALKQALPKLVQIIQHAMSRQAENVAATENAIAAITKILKYRPEALDNYNEMLIHWFSWLPVWEDEDEAGHIYSFLCDLIEANNPQILGANNQHLPRILSILGDAFDKDAVDTKSSAGQRMIIIIKQIKASDEIYRTCMSQLTRRQQEAIVDVLEEQ